MPANQSVVERSMILCAGFPLGWRHVLRPYSMSQCPSRYMAACSAGVLRSSSNTVRNNLGNGISKTMLDRRVVFDEPGIIPVGQTMISGGSRFKCAHEAGSHAGKAETCSQAQATHTVSYATLPPLPVENPPSYCFRYATAAEPISLPHVERRGGVAARRERARRLPTTEVCVRLFGPVQHLPRVGGLGGSCSCAGTRRAACGPRAACTAPSSAPPTAP